MNHNCSFNLFVIYLPIFDLMPRTSTKLKDSFPFPYFCAHHVPSTHGRLKTGFILKRSTNLYCPWKESSAKCLPAALKLTDWMDIGIFIQCSISAVLSLCHNLSHCAYWGIRNLSCGCSETRHVIPTTSRADVDPGQRHSSKVIPFLKVVDINIKVQIQTFLLPNSF